MDIQVAINETGPANVLTVMENTPQTPSAGEIRIRHHAIGVNYIDIYHRSGLYPPPAYPAVLGVEGAGIVEAVGEGVSNVKPGDRVAYAGLPVGSYASTRLLPAARAVPLPEDVSFEIAAASMLRGLTVHMLVHRVFRVQAGDTLLVHAAAGGLGLYLTHWAKHLGASVIGMTSTEAKAAVAKEAGADHVIVGRDADFATAVNELTNGRGVNGVMDGIGGENFLRNFSCVASFGTVASVGQAGGPVPPVPASALSQKSSFFARPSVIAYTADNAVYQKAAREMLAMISKGVAATIGATYPLAHAAEAQRDMEAGQTTGSLLLIP